MFLFFYFIIYIKWIHFIINQIIKLGKYMKIYIVWITYIIKLLILFLITLKRFINKYYLYFYFNSI